MGIDLNKIWEIWILADEELAHDYTFDELANIAREDIKALCQEVESLRKELTEYYKQDNQTHRLIAKIEILEAKNETLRELVEEFFTSVEDWIELPNGKDFKDMTREIIKIMQEYDHSLQGRTIGKLRNTIKELRTKIAKLEGKANG